MPRRPGGGESPANSVESGLRQLVLGPGPDIRVLSKAESGGLRRIMDQARPPGNWPDDAKAAAVLALMREKISGLENPRWRAAAEGAFRIPMDLYVGSRFDSLASRFKVLAERDGAEGREVKVRSEAYRGYWIAAAKHLAGAIEQEIDSCNRSPELWTFYRSSDPPAPPRSLPISFDRTDVLFRFRGRRGIQSITYRWLTAHGSVDSYEAVGWYYNQPDAPVEIVPLANCTLTEPLSDLPLGGKAGRLRFAKSLEPGDQYFFAYTTIFHSEEPCRPTILYEVRGLSMRSLTVRAQFDPSDLPEQLWWVDMGGLSESHGVPSRSSPDVLEINAVGYVQHEFPRCDLGRKYGLMWVWS